MPNVPPNPAAMQARDVSCLRSHRLGTFRLRRRARSLSPTTDVERSTVRRYKCQHRRADQVSGGYRCPVDTRRQRRSVNDERRVQGSTVATRHLYRVAQSRQASSASVHCRHRCVCVSVVGVGLVRDRTDTTDRRRRGVGQ